MALLLSLTPAAQELTTFDLRSPREVVKIQPPDGQGDDRFGHAVALHGNTLVVGAPEHDAAQPRGGAVYVFDRDAGGPDAWGQVAKLLPPDPGPGDWNFGWSVAIEGDVLAVGRPWYGDGDPSERRGAVHVYEKVGGTWTPTAMLVGEPRSQLGTSLDLEGERLVAGAPAWHCVGFSCAPLDRVAVYERDAGGRSAWGRTATLFAPADRCMGLGWTVHLRRELLVTSAASYCNPNGNQVLLHELERSGEWGPAVHLEPPRADGTEVFLDADPVALSDDLLCVRVRLLDVPDPDQLVVVYRLPPTGGTPVWTAAVLSPDGAEPRGDLGLRGDALFVGVRRPGGPAPGRVDVFLRDLGGRDAFGHAFSFSPTDGTPDDHFGDALALSGRDIAVGAPKVSLSDPGAVYVYEIPRPPDVRHAGRIPR